MKKTKPNKQKQLRTPISSNFTPKRLAINFQPPMIILQYLVIDTGKLYHHKIRLDSLFKRANATREDILNYIKTKHHLYFIHGKIKDIQLYKFIDKIITRRAITGAQLNNDHLKPLPKTAQQYQHIPKKQKDDDFDYLNDQQQQQYYEEDYEDYQDPTNFTNHHLPATKKQHPSKSDQMNKCMIGKQRNQTEGKTHVGWDLDLDQNDDFV